MRSLSKKLVMVMCLGLVLLINRSWADAPNVENGSNGSQKLHGHVPQEVETAAKVAHSDANQNLDLRIVLPLRNQDQLEKFLEDLYNPKSPYYLQFVSPTLFAQQYGPEAGSVNAVKQYLTSKGLTVEDQPANGFVLQATGTVAKVEEAFQVHINNYKKTDGTLFFAPDVDPTIPSAVSGKIIAIAGLDNVAKFQAHNHKSPTAISANLGTGPGGFIAPKDIYKAYNLNTITSNGAGQTLALVELDGYLPSDISFYENYFQIPSVPLQNVLIDGFSGKPTASGGSAEVTLDIQLAAAFAPGLSKILVYEAPNSNRGWIDEWNRIASDNQAKTISCSWGLSETYSTTVSFDNSIFMQMAAQGQAIFIASGDCGAYDTCQGKKLSVDEPSDQPYGTGVGITKVSLNSDGTYSTEVASRYGGGGVSKYFSIPSYQKNMITKNSSGSTTMRNVPDLSFTADNATAYSFYINGSWAGYWGSSLSAPIWAAFISRVNQGRVNLGRPALGFINPVFYQIAQGSHYTQDFHDVLTGTNGYYPAVAGYDDATGLGSFNGSSLFNDMVSF
jgi:subtilase family serine protease